MHYTWRCTEKHLQKDNRVLQFHWSAIVYLLFMYSYSCIHNTSRDGWETGTVLKIEHSLPPEPDLPRSARERCMGFFVWCLCFLNRTKLIFSLSSGPINPSSICRSMMSSTGDKSGSGLHIGMRAKHYIASKKKLWKINPLVCKTICSEKRLRWFRKH